MIRCFEQRDMLASLLSSPSRLSHDKSVDNNPVRRLAAHLNDGNVAHFPAYELKSILTALAGECQGSLNHSYGNGDDSQKRLSIDQPPRKRPKRLQNNNLHSILRFVERVVGQRYKEKAKCKKDDSSFLEDELKIYFGTDDASFQAEEEVLCLAFGMALNSIKQNVGGSGAGIVHGSIGDGVIKTALRIIDSVVTIDRRERSIRNKLQKIQEAKKKNQLVLKANRSDRRKKYEHLLQPAKKLHINERNQSDASSEVKSIMEEKYSKRWKWLLQFRASYEIIPGGQVELQQSHYHSPPSEQSNQGSAIDEKAPNPTSAAIDEKEKEIQLNFVIVRRRIETLDDISLSSHDSDEEMDKDLGMSDAEKQVHDQCDDGHPEKSDIGNAPFNTTDSLRPEQAPAATTTPTSPLADAPSPCDKLDQETYELRLTLLDMPPGESMSAAVVWHTVDEIATLLNRYGELDGANGIARCGEVLEGKRTIDVSIAKTEASDESTADGQFPLNDACVSSLVKAFLTDATGALRANAFLKSFVLPLMIEMNPTARAAATGSNVRDVKVAKNNGKPASRLLTSLLATLARDRPTECVLSVIAPTLVLKKYNPSIPSALEASYEPTRFQCELISRVLRGKDALSTAAITLLVEQVLPTNGRATTSDPSTSGGMKWTENTMPVLTACLNRQPTLADDVVAKLAEEASHYLSPNASQSMIKSMKFSTLFHALVTKYGSQVKSTGRVESLTDSASRLKTFMSKTIGLSLKKLS